MSPSTCKVRRSMQLLKVNTRPASHSKAKQLIYFAGLPPCSACLPAASASYSLSRLEYADWNVQVGDDGLVTLLVSAHSELWHQTGFPA